MTPADLQLAVQIASDYEAASSRLVAVRTRLAELDAILPREIPEVLTDGERALWLEWQRLAAEHNRLVGGEGSEMARVVAGLVGEIRRLRGL